MGDILDMRQGAVDQVLDTCCHRRICQGLALADFSFGLAIVNGNNETENHFGAGHGALERCLIFYVVFHDFYAFLHQSLSSSAGRVATGAANSVFLREHSVVQDAVNDRATLLAGGTEDDKELGHDLLIEGTAMEEDALGPMAIDDSGFHAMSLEIMSQEQASRSCLCWYILVCRRGTLRQKIVRGVDLAEMEPRQVRWR